MPQPGIIDQDLVVRPEGEEDTTCAIIFKGGAYMGCPDNSIFGYRQAAAPPVGDPVQTVFLMNSNQPAGSAPAVDDTGFVSLSHSGFDGFSQVAPPLTGQPAWYGANAWQKSTNAYNFNDDTSYSLTQSAALPLLDVTDGVDFMVEFRVRFTVETGVAQNRDLFVLVNSSTDQVLRVSHNRRTLSLHSLNQSRTGETQLPQNAWAHIVVTRRGTMWNMYVDGIKETTHFDNIAPIVDNAFIIQIWSHLEDQPIYDGVRMVKGAACYYDAFFPPTVEPLVITVDPKIGGRVVFLSNAENGAPGSRPATNDFGYPVDYNATTGGFYNANSGPTVEAGGKFAQGFKMLQPFGTEFPPYPNCAMWGLGSMRFNSYNAKFMCIEAWFKADALNSSTHYAGIAYDSWDGTNTGTDLQFGFRVFPGAGGGPMVSLLRADATSFHFQPAGLIATNWNHYAAVLDNGVARLFVNGTFVGDWGSSFTSTSGGKGKPIIKSVGDVLVNDMFDGFRFTLGSPVYTENFAVPVAPPSTSIP